MMKHMKAVWSFLIVWCCTLCYATAMEIQIPFQDYRGAMIIDVKIGTNSYPMLFDCGATMCITPQLWEELHLEELQSETCYDSQGNKMTSKRASLPPVSISGKVYNELTAMLLDIEKIPGMNCYGIYGVVGPEVIGNSVWRIDFEKNVIIVSDTANYCSKGFISVPLIKRFNGQPWFYLRAGSRDSILTCFDTGSNGNLSLNRKSISPDFMKHTAIESYEYGFTGSGGGGYGRMDTVCHVVAKKGVRIGRYSLKHVDVKLHNKPANLLGTGIMKHFVIILDYYNNKILFKPTASNDAKEEKSNSCSGITFGYLNNHIIIASVRGKTRTECPSVPVGSFVVAVNGRRINRPAMPADLCDLLTCYYANGIQSVTIMNKLGQEQMLELNTGNKSISPIHTNKQ